MNKDVAWALFATCRTDQNGWKANAALWLAEKDFWYPFKRKTGISVRSEVLRNALSYSRSPAVQRSITPQGQIACFELQRRKQVLEENASFPMFRCRLAFVEEKNSALKEVSLQIVYLLQENMI